MNSIARLRQISRAEGVSYLLLLGIAMPLKYLAGWPLAVKIVGLAHGLLFIALCLSLLQTVLAVRWPISRGLLVFVAALLPFAPFLLDRKLTAWQAEAASPGS